MTTAESKKLAIVLGIIAGLGSVVSIMTYIENRKDKKLKDEILVLDRQIKELDLARKRQGRA